MKWEIGSREELLAHFGLQHEDYVDYLKTMIGVDATIRAGNAIVQAITKSPAAEGSNQGAKLHEALRKELIPSDKAADEAKAERFKRIMKREMEGGAIKIRTVDSGKKARLRRKKRS